MNVYEFQLIPDGQNQDIYFLAMLDKLAFLFKNAWNRDLENFSILFLTVAWFQAFSD